MPPELRGALVTFLLSAFSPDELARLVRYMEGGDEVLYAVPSRGVSPRGFVEELVDALERFGLLDDTRVFDSLRRERPRRVPEIDKLAAAHQRWLAARSGAAAGPDVPAQPPHAADPAAQAPAPAPGEGWDMFLVHASLDKPRVRALDRAIYAENPKLRVFFDERSIDPGDNWAFVIPDALRRSRMVVVCLSTTSDGGWYNHSEIASAVVQARENAIRIVPVYLDGRYKGVPYGLETLVGISVPETGIEGTAKKLVELVGKAPRNVAGS